LRHLQSPDKIKSVDFKTRLALIQFPRLLCDIAAYTDVTITILLKECSIVSQLL
jgi:hypothetical protein